MSEPNPTEFLADSLSPIARAERRNLLIASTAGILVSKAGLLPTQISALGITLSSPKQSAFVLVLALSIAYFLCAFILYGAADFLIWRKKYQEYLEHVDSYSESWSQEDQHAYDERRERVPNIAWLYRASPLVAFARALLEYVVPIIVGSCAAVFLLV